MLLANKIKKLTIYTKQNSDEHMLAADWPRLSCRVDGRGRGEEGRGGDRHALLTSLSLSLSYPL
jgi:hypothetical protein